MLLLPLAMAAPPSIDTPLRTGASSPADAAVVIGIEHYPLLGRDVPYAEADAQAVADTFVYTRGIPLGRVLTLTGSTTREDILAGVRELGKQVHKGGTLFVYFAGHGAAAGSSRTLLGADVKATTDSFAARGVLTNEVNNLGAAGGGRVVMLVDACFGGASRDGTDLLKGTRFVVPVDPDAGQWAATAENQVAAPLTEAGHGLFTYLAVGAMRGWADGELSGKRDGVVTTDEAQAWVTSALHTMGRTGQTPKLAADLGGFTLTKGVKEAIDGAVLAGLRGATDAPAAASSAGFADLSIGVAGKLKEQQCLRDAEEKGEAARADRLAAAVEAAQAEARATWSRLGPEAEACLGLGDAAERADCAATVELFASRAGDLTVTVPAGTERVATDCGTRETAYAAQSQAVTVPEVALARVAAARLRQGAKRTKVVKAAPERVEKVKPVAAERVATVKPASTESGKVRATAFVAGGVPLLSAGVGARWPSGVTLGVWVYGPDVGLSIGGGGCGAWLFGGGGPALSVPLSARWNLDVRAALGAGMTMECDGAVWADVGLPAGLTYVGPRGLRLSAGVLSSYGNGYGFGLAPELNAGWQW